MINVIFNPNNLPVEQLPVVYGYNAGGRMNALTGKLISEDGEKLGYHVSVDEESMAKDLGIFVGFGDEKHQDIQQYYPNGYKMEFVDYFSVSTHTKLLTAISISDQKPHLQQPT